MKERYAKAHMKAAYSYAELSHCRRLQVGCVIVKDDRIISIGFNGTPKGWDNVCEEIEWCSAGGWLDPEEIIARWPYEGTYKDQDGNEIQGRYRLITKPEVIHAEANAITKLAKTTGGGQGASVFITHAPCLECAKQIATMEVKEVYFGQYYRDDAGIHHLLDNRIPVVYLPIKEQEKGEIHDSITGIETRTDCGC